MENLDEKGEEGEDTPGGALCWGEYRKHTECRHCTLRERCRRFQAAVERGTSLRYRGKYKGRGKEKRRDKY